MPKTTKPRKITADSRIADVHAAVAKALRDKNSKVTLSEGRISTVNGEDIGFNFNVTFVRDSDTRHSPIEQMANNRRRVVLGDFGERKSYPEPKDGFDYGKFADALIEMAKRAKQARANSKRLNKLTEAASKSLARLLAKHKWLLSPGSSALLTQRGAALELTLYTSGWSEQKMDEVLTSIAPFVRPREVPQ